MRKAMTIAIMTIASFSALGATQPAGATPPCADCVIDGVVAMAGWHDWDSFTFNGTIVGTLVRADEPAIAVTGSISGYAYFSRVGTTSAAIGSGQMTVTMRGCDACGPSAEASWGFYLVGNGLTWTIANNGTSSPLAGAIQLAVPRFTPTPNLKAGTYTGSISGAV